jgi:hypothetical protein
VRAELYLSQYTLDIRYRASKNNIVSNILSRLIRLKYDSNSLSENKDILEDIINKYHYYNVIVIEMSDEFKNNIKKEYDDKNRWQKIYKRLRLHGRQIERFLINDDNLIYYKDFSDFR